MHADGQISVGDPPGGDEQPRIRHAPASPADRGRVVVQDSVNGVEYVEEGARVILPAEPDVQERALLERPEFLSANVRLHHGARLVPVGIQVPAVLRLAVWCRVAAVRVSRAVIFFVQQYDDDRHPVQAGIIQVGQLGTGLRKRQPID
jgi:hypothetical protein